MKNKRSVKHKVGNIISGILGIVDGIVLTISLGNYSPYLVLAWNVKRRSNKILYDNKK